MRNKSVTYVVQAAVIAALYVVLTITCQCAWIIFLQYSGTIFRSIVYPSVFYTGSDTGTLDRMSDSEPDDRSYHLGYCIWKYCNIDRSGRYVSVA